jgi:hypothetical protein
LFSSELNIDVALSCLSLWELILSPCSLRQSETGYWALVSYFTRTEAVRTINQLPAVKTYMGRGEDGGGGGGS